MPWPDIFFPKKRPENSTPPPLPTPPPEAPKIQEPPPSSTPTRPPVSGMSPRPSVEPLTAAAIKAASVRAEGTRTLPVMHGVVLRPLTRTGGKLTFPTPPVEPIKNIEQLMNEADPVKTLSQTGSVRMLKRLSPEAPALRPPGTPPPIRAEDIAPEPAPAAAVIVPPKAIEADSPWPSFAAKDAPRVYIEQKKPEPDQPIRKAEPIAPAIVPVEAKAETPVPTVAGPIATPVLAQPRPVTRESTFLTRPAVISATPAATRPPPPSLPPMISIGSIAKRKAKLADVARLVLPPKREETGPLPLPPASDPSSTETAGLPATPNVVAPSTARLPIRHLPRLVLPHPHAAPVNDSPFMERAKATPAEEKIEVKPVEPTPVEMKPVEPEVAKAPEPIVAPAPEAPTAESKPEAVAPIETPKPEPVVIVPPAFDFVPKTDFEAPKLDPSLVFDPATMPKIEPRVEAPKVEEHKVEVMSPAFEPVLQPDPEAHKTAPDVAPRLDPEAHKDSPPVQAAVEAEKEPATSTEIEPSVAAGTREFHLTNGERVAGVVLSETADTLYVQHASLGVLTIPRDEIATRLAEIILINGDRIVGNIMAETADTLYVRHASLGMLSVPKAQRSRRVVEAILKNGDRILGEVLTETDTFTVIKSATLGTVTVPHNKVNMLNRKIEQIEMKALPSPFLQG
jgi:RNase P/RNase MRP subunit p29